MLSGHRYNIGDTCPSMIIERLVKPKILWIDEDVKKRVMTF